MKQFHLPKTISKKSLSKYYITGRQMPVRKDVSIYFKRRQMVRGEEPFGHFCKSAGNGFQPGAGFGKGTNDSCLNKMTKLIQPIQMKRVRMPSIADKCHPCHRALEVSSQVIANPPQLTQNF